MIPRWGRPGESRPPLRWADAVQLLRRVLARLRHREPSLREPAMFDHCPSFVLIAPGRRVRCIVPDPAHDPTGHIGHVRVALADGRERVATLLWSDVGREHDDTEHAD